MTTFTTNTEVVSGATFDADANLDASAQPVAYFAQLTETLSATLFDADANLIIPAPYSGLLFQTSTEVIDTGEIVVAYWESDIVAQFVMASVPTSRTTLYTVPVGRNAIIRWMDLVNTTGSAITVDVWLNNVQWENDRSVAGNDKYARDTITELGPGQLIEMQASGAGVNAFMAGVLELTS